MPLCRTRDTSLSYLWLGASVAGEFDPIVLVHGLGSSLAFWYPVIAPALSQNHRVLSLDLRGHGRSEITPSGYTSANLAADLAALFSALGIRRAHIVGHSFGGSVGLAFALQNPSAVKSLTLIDTRIRALQPQAGPAPRRPGPPPRQRFGRLRAGLDEDIEPQASGIDFLTKIAEAKLRQPAGIKPFARTASPSPFSGMAGKAAAARWLELVRTTTLSADVAMPETTAIDQIGRWKFPTLLLYGEYSHNTQSAVALKQACSIARLETVAGAGHFFPLTRPDAVLAPLRRLLDRDALGPVLSSEDYTIVSDA